MAPWLFFHKMINSGQEAMHKSRCLYWNSYAARAERLLRFSEICSLDDFISYYGSLEGVVEHKDEIYFYPDCDSMEDVARYLVDELQTLGEIPPSLQYYIDYEAYGRDLEIGGYFIETSYGMCEIQQ